VVIGYGYFFGETAFGLEVRLLVGASPAVTACSLTRELPNRGMKSLAWKTFSQW